MGVRLERARQPAVGVVVFFEQEVIKGDDLEVKRARNMIFGSSGKLGKRFLGLRVIIDDGEPARFVAVAVRNLLRVIDFLPAFYGLGLVTLIVSSRSQRLGDYAGGTFVVRAPRPRRNWSALRTLSALPRIAPAGGETATAATAPTLRVLPGEAQRLVREFVLREQKLTPAARTALAKQLAERLRPLLPEFQVTDNVELIRTVARSLRAKGDDVR